MVARRLLTVVGSMVVIFALTATAAFAHFCYNASRSDTGNANAKKSQVFFSVEDGLAELRELGVCEDEIDAFEDALLADGLDPANILIHERAVMASGTFGTPLATNGKGIDHLTPYFDELFAMLGCVEGAFA